MDEATFIILKIAITVCATILTAYAVPYISQLRQDSRYRGVLDVAAMAVRTAEQTVRGEGRNTRKKEVATAVVAGWLVSHGIAMTEMQVSDLIEAAVYAMKESRNAGLPG